VQHIRKNNSPREFTEWKALKNDDWKPDWENFRDPEKTCVHHSLLEEQGFICCYCGKLIEKSNSHIEHLKPRSQYPDLALDYQNLLASCQGERQDNEYPIVPIHCGHQRKNWYDEQLMVSPLNPDCTSFFDYTLDGQILPSQEPDRESAAEETIEQLGLNVERLRRLRQRIIRETLSDIGSLTVEQIQQLIQGYGTLNAQRQYSEFCFVIIYILRQELIIRPIVP
jgi:uncharacterized protein (TIGR02646 family)